jgi:hypothetical protein
MFERLKMYGEILQHHCNQGNSDKIVQCCKHFGTRDPSLWITALGYFASQPEIDMDHVLAVTKVRLLPCWHLLNSLKYTTIFYHCRANLIEQAIEEQRLLPPLMYASPSTVSKKNLEDALSFFRIVQTLSSNPNACLGLASEHISNVMRSLKDSILEDQQKVNQVAFIFCQLVLFSIRQFTFAQV